MTCITQSVGDPLPIGSLCDAAARISTDRRHWPGVRAGLWPGSPARAYAGPRAGRGGQAKAAHPGIRRSCLPGVSVSRQLVGAR
jgi:hypothetical protein